MRDYTPAKAPHTTSETAAAYVEVSRLAVGSRGHGVTGTTTKNRLPIATINAGVAAEMLKDNPHLAQTVTAVRSEGVDRGYPVKVYARGGQAVLDMWVAFLGPAARLHPPVESEVQWERAVSTLDVLVIVSHEIGGA
jgi:hypothetical protein